MIDECSMVDAELGRDLMSFGVPVLVLGDPAQLPPVQGGGFFTDVEPDAMLTEVHRQAQDDPIVRLSMQVRDGERLRARANTARPSVVRRADFDPQRALETDQILVGRNATRRAYNARMRERRGFDRSAAARPATSWSACATTARKGCSTAACGTSPRSRRRAGRSCGCI